MLAQTRRHRLRSRSRSGRNGNGRYGTYGRKSKPKWEFTRSQFSQHYFRIMDRPFTFHQRDWLEPIFDSPSHRVVFRTGRQVSKSTSQAATMLEMAATHPSFRTLYVTPTTQQMREFSNLRLAPMIKDSPIFRAVYWNTECQDQVSNRSLRNRSHITLGSAYHSADSLRGISSHFLCLDEVQDILMENIKVLEQTTFAARSTMGMDPYFLYCGTPKTTSHSIEAYWDASTQNFWGVKCFHCNFWNVPLGEQNVQQAGLSCRKCGRLIEDVIGQGEWIRSFEDKRWQGWHISQLMCPWANWEDIWDQYAGPRPSHIALFYNEVLGFPYDLGVKPINEEEVKQNCRAGYSITEEAQETEEFKRATPRHLFAGVDWALQSPDLSIAPSFTILTIGGYEGNRLKVVEIKKYMGYESDPTYVLKDIEERCKKWGVRVLGCDHGVGHKENERLRGILGFDSVHEFMYIDNLAKKIDWDADRHAYKLNRTRVLLDVLSDLKRVKYVFPKWEEFHPYSADITSIFADSGNKFRRELKFDHAPSEPDDFLHSLNYMTLAAKHFHRTLFSDAEEAADEGKAARGGRRRSTRRSRL